MKLFTALRFLTTIPLPHRRETSAEELGRSAVYFPLVGLIIGLILAGLNWVFRMVLPAPLVSAMLIVVMIILTGGLHLDGLSDTCDGIGGHKSAEERWQVMRDSHVGSFGAIGIAALLLVKYVALSSVPPNLMMVSLLFMPVVSRWAMVYAIFAHPYARPSGLGISFKQSTRWLAFTIATLITVTLAIVMIPLFQFAGLIIIICIGLNTTLMAVYFKSKFGGLTGDTYGAINEVSEAGVLLLIALLANLGLV
ncbi:MAG: adenosylcobinamide-GDP ribazoletransferase [Dehalococcoidales bacterium]|nr:adenosylcobinamide-GDP ribazoletransferase [Dehalococcoidales bacterium]